MRQRHRIPVGQRHKILKSEVMSFYGIHKHHQTLLEVIIAMALTIIILTTLNFFYQQVDALDTKITQVQAESFRMRYLENRLAAILPTAQSLKNAPKDFYFFTGKDVGTLIKPGSSTLVFTYDKGVDLNKKLSNNVLGRLYLDTSDRFCLATWPSPLRWKVNANPEMLKEVLLEEVEMVKMSFFFPPRKPRKDFSEKKEQKLIDQNSGRVPPTEPEGQWTDSWDPGWLQLPALIRIEITRKSMEKYVLVYPFPNCEKTIVYER